EQAIAHGWPQVEDQLEGRAPDPIKRRILSPDLVRNSFLLVLRHVGVAQQRSDLAGHALIARRARAPSRQLALARPLEHSHPTLAPQEPQPVLLFPPLPALIQFIVRLGA